MSGDMHSQQMNAWVWPYISGVALFSLGCGMTFGLSGVLIGVGVVLMLGGFGQFILMKIASMPKGVA